METDASLADSRVVEPGIKHDCDVLILEYVVWDALSSVITLAQTRSARKDQTGSSRHKDASVHEVTEKLRMVDSYLTLCHTSDPAFSLSPQTSFLIQLLQFSALFTLRHDRSAVCASPGSITSRRQVNHTRAERWREAVGNGAWPSRLLDVYSLGVPGVGRGIERYGKGKDDIGSEERGMVGGGDEYRAWNAYDKTINGQPSSRRSNGNSSRNSFSTHNRHSNGDNNDNAWDRHQGKHQATVNRDHASETKPEAAKDEEPDFITLLDLLPPFMDLTATIMSTGLHDPTPSSPPSSPSKSSTTTDLIWASEPQWLDLAARFMLQAVIEQYLLLHQHGSATPILDAFAWGKFPAVQSAPFTGERAREAVSVTRSMTIPDSDEGDITALGNTPVSSPDNTPSSHPSLFVMQSEDSPESAGATWRRLRMQALSLLEPPKPVKISLPNHGAHIETHLHALSQHHKYADFETSMLEFLAHLFHSRQPPLLTQLETVYPAWMASGPPGVLSQATPMQTQSPSQTGPPPDRRGWLAATNLNVRAGSMELTEEEVDKLMHMLSMQWFSA